MNNEPKAGQGIDPELLAAYIDNRLSPEQRAVVEAQLASDPDSYAVLVDTLKALDDEAVGAVEVTEPSRSANPKTPVIPIPKRSTRAPMMRWAIAGGALATAAAIALAVWTQPNFLTRLRGGAPSDRLIAGLVDAVGEERYLEARLTGGFRFGPLRTATRSTEPSAQNLALVAEAGRLQKLVATEPTPERLHALGIAMLLLGQSEQAADLLEDAAQRQPASAAVQSDLAAAYLSAPTDIEDRFPRSVEAADAAIRLDSSLVEPLFVRALALEKMGLRQQAIEAWKKYLERDPDSAWAADAKARLLALSDARDPVSSRPPQELGDRLLTLAGVGDVRALDALIRADSQNVRRFLELEWLEETSRSGVTLNRAETVARRFTALTGDQLPTDLYVDLGRQISERRRSVVGALSGVAAASDASRFDDLSALAEKHLATVREVRPAWQWLEYHRLHALSQSGQILPAIEGLRTLEEKARRAGYLHLQGVIVNRIGQGYGRLDDQQNAIVTRHRAIALFTRTLDFDQVASMHAMLSECYRFLGDSNLAFSEHWQSLALNPHIRSHRTRNQVLMQAGVTLGQASYPGAAVEFFLEAQAAGEKWTTYPAAGVNALSWLAQTLGRAGLKPEAQRAIQHARAALPGIPDAGFRRRNELDLLEAEALVATPDRAVAILDDALATFQGTGYDVRMPQLLLRRGIVLEAKGDPRSRESFEAGIRYLEDARASLVNLSLRNAQLDLFAGLQEGVARAELADGQEDAVIARLDSIKARSSEESTDTVNASAQSPSHWRDIVSDDRGILFLADLDGRTHVWLLTNRGARHSVIAIPTTVLSRYVEIFRRALLRRDVDQVQRVGNRLWTVLMEKPLGEVPQLRALVIIPTRVLSGVPFAALRQGNGRFIAEDYTLTMAPSLRMYARAALTLIGSARTRSALIASGGQGHGLAPLPAVLREIQEVAALYGHAQLLNGPTASEESFLDALMSSDVFHFAGHAVTSAEGVGLYLGNSTSDKVVTQADLMSRRLRGQTIVLAACSSAYAASPRQAVDASLSLAGTFLAAGASAVAGMLWDIEDDDAARLALELHRHLATGQSLPEAITAVQRAQIQSGRPLSEWSALVSVGAM